MSYEWITPKTDWASTSRFEYTDYNRIRNNLLYINDMLNEMFPDKSETLDLGEAKEGYGNDYAVSEFVAFEDALESFTRVGIDVNIGNRNYYYGNASFIWADALNRLESCCLRWKTQTDSVVEEIVCDTDWQIPYYRYSYLPITLLPSSATNKSDLTARLISGNDIVSNVRIENGQLKVFSNDVGSAIVKLSCGEVEEDVDITVEDTASYLHMSATRGGDDQIGGVMLWNDGRSLTFYVVTTPKNAVDKNNYTIALDNPSIVNITRNSDELTFTPLKKGNSNFVLSINGFDNRMYIVVT